LDAVTEQVPAPLPIVTVVVRFEQEPEAEYVSNPVPLPPVDPTVKLVP
jgi:hypothetical protein